MMALEPIVEGFRGRRVLVVGDVVADEFVYGEIARVSREAPVMILKYESTETVPGGAGNAAANVAALGAEVALVGVVGRDRVGRSTLLALRARGVDTSGVASVAGLATPTKTRILAGLAHSLRQQVIRIDREPETAPAGAHDARLIGRLEERLPWADAVILSDYGYGAVSDGVAGALRRAASERGVPVVVDSRFRLGELGGFTSATPNEVELEAIAGRALETEGDVIGAGERLASDLGIRSLLVTRGSRGLVVLEPGRDPVSVAAVGAEAIDVTGAGDTVIATYALGLAGGASFADAARVANVAGGLVVMKRGTATVSADELVAAIRANAHRESSDFAGT